MQANDLLDLKLKQPELIFSLLFMRPGDLQDLSSRLSRLADTHRAAPLMTVDYAGTSSRQASDAQMLDSRHGAGQEKEEYTDWEVL